jgi:hypothetical protein
MAANDLNRSRPAESTSGAHRRRRPMTGEIVVARQGPCPWATHPVRWRVDATVRRAAG